MKYYSEKLKKFFDEPNQLEVEEKEFEEKEAKLKADIGAKIAEISKDKKQMSKAIEEASNKVQDAYVALKMAKEEAAQILEESNDKVEQILKNATDELKKAQKERTDAIVAFNSKYGPYSTVYTGEKARKDYLEISQLFNDLFNSFWKF